LTLSLTFVCGKPRTACKQWEVNLRLLEDVSGTELRRLWICILFDGDSDSQDTIQQVKATQWKALGRVLDRFPELVEVAVTVNDGSEDSEVWAEVYEQLHPAVPARILLIKRFGCVL
jgi:hypothetical protein